MSDDEIRKAEQMTAEDVFAANLKTLRDDRDLSQETLAKDMTERGFKWTQATVYKVEAGTRKIQLGEARAVAAIFDVPLDQLTEGTSQIAELARLRSDLRRLSEVEKSLISVADSFNGLRWSIRERAGIDPPSRFRPQEVVTLLSDEEQSEIRQATEEDAEDVVRRPPF